MIDAAAVVALGFLLGMRHATDADHVVAVTTIVSRERSIRLAAGLGAIWGLGHTATILLAGGAIILFKLAVPPRLTLALELAVGLMLMLLGLRNLVGARRTHVARVRVPHGLRMLAVGVVHGLAGSAAIALLVLTAIRDARWALAYLLVFGAGTVTGMTLMTTTLAWPVLRVGRRSEATHRRLQVVTGLISLAFGLVIAYRIGSAG